MVLKFLVEVVGAEQRRDGSLGSQVPPVVMR